MATIRSVGEDDWEEWRELRQAALVDSPDAFDATLAEWTGAGDTEERWRARLTSVPCNVVADADGVPVGMASAYPRPGGEVELISVWVSPKGRGLGVGDALIEAVVAWAAERGAPAVMLFVRHANEHAIGLYARHGFVDAGWATDPDHPLPERKMVRPLAPG